LEQSLYVDKPPHKCGAFGRIIKQFSECEKYILSIPKFSQDKHNLEDLQQFLAKLGNPQLGKKIIHVAGTNGKGSVCAYLHFIFQASGISTGLFTSPHLITMRERIKINDEIVSEDNFISAFEIVKKNITDFHPTFFEFLFLMAMLIFDDAGVECLILETGLGGRLDATNAIREKDLTIITPISFDHMEYLGTTLTAIAGEKLGILRVAVPVVSAIQEPDVMKFIEQKAAEYESPFTVINNNAIKINKIALKTIDFSYQYRYDIVVRTKLSTKALYQIENASLAIHSALIFNDERISIKSITDGLNQTVWQGRMEELDSGIIIDGAHNENGILAFMQTVKNIACEGRKFLLFGGVREKQSKKMIDILREDAIFDEIIACVLDNLRSLGSEDYKSSFLPEQVYPNVKSGLLLLINKKQTDDLIFITGSLYLYSEVIQVLTEGTDD